MVIQLEYRLMPWMWNGLRSVMREANRTGIVPFSLIYWKEKGEGKVAVKRQNSPKDQNLP